MCTVNSLFKKDLKLQIHLQKAFFLDGWFCNVWREFKRFVAPELAVGFENRCQICTKNFLRALIWYIKQLCSSNDSNSIDFWWNLFQEKIWKHRGATIFSTFGLILLISCYRGHLYLDLINSLISSKWLDFILVKFLMQEKTEKNIWGCS